MRLVCLVFLLGVSAKPRRFKHVQSLVTETCPCGGGTNRTADCGCESSSGVLPVVIIDRKPVVSDSLDEPMGKSTGLRITDQTLLSVYKGHDASDREGVADYGDVIHDFRQGWKLWPQNEIKFVIDDTVGNCERSTLNVALSVISRNSAVSFSQLSHSVFAASSPVPALHITDRPGGCFASLGYRSPGENVVNIGAGCVNVGTVMHLVLHALGLFHEHQRPDRDSFVKIVNSNVDLGRIGGNAGTVKFETVFGKTQIGQSDWVHVMKNKPYDYASIMHNGPCHYAVSQEFAGGPAGCALEPTLTAIDVQSKLTFWGAPSDIGNRATLSAGDVALLAALYGSPRQVEPATTISVKPADGASAQNQGGASPTNEEDLDLAEPEVSPLETTSTTTVSVPTDAPYTRASSGDFWPAEPEPVTLSDALSLPSYVPDPSDATTPETTVCTINDAADFVWSDRAREAQSHIARKDLRTTGGSTGTAFPTLSPNEDIMFRSYFMEATSARLMYTVLGGLAFVLLVGGLVIYFVSKRRSLNRRGLKRIVEQQGEAGEAPLLSNVSSEPRETGDTTDSEVYADILEDNDGFGPLPSQQAAEGEVTGAQSSGPSERQDRLV
jgi:hypothetical protein